MAILKSCHSCFPSPKVSDRTVNPLRRILYQVRHVACRETIGLHLVFPPCANHLIHSLFLHVFAIYPFNVAPVRTRCSVSLSMEAIRVSRRMWRVTHHWRRQSAAAHTCPGYDAEACWSELIQLWQVKPLIGSATLQPKCDWITLDDAVLPGWLSIFWGTDQPRGMGGFSASGTTCAG